jgi:uncharacterized damage-inducible protein DinB
VEDQPFAEKKFFDEDAKSAHLVHIKMLPQLLEFAIENLDSEQLQTPYREGGWTVHQLVHHVADSHMNAFIRFKLGLTEENPTIKPYDQTAWANLGDTLNLPVNVSLTILHALHAKLHELLKSVKESEWQRTVFHPEQKRQITLWNLLSTYSWHGRHHVAHITTLRKQKGW